MPPSINIVYHNPSVTRPNQWAGERGRQLIAAMDRKGSKVRAIPPPDTATGGSGTGSRRPISKWARAHIPRAWRGPLIRLRLLQRGTTNTVRWSWRLWRQLRSAPPDVLVARYHEFEWTPLIAARLLRRPLVLEVHSPFGVEGTLRGKRPSRLEGWMDRVFWRHSDIIWAHTPALRDLIAAETPDPGKIRLVPFGVDDPEVIATPGSSDETVEIVFAGSFYPWHGIEDLLAAFAVAHQQVPALRLTLIGDGIERSDHEQQARALQIDDVVSFPGWLSRPGVYQHLQRSHLGVAPYRRTRYSYFEPVKILDYQMAGLPIVASEVGHIPQMVGDGESGLLVPPGDVEALAVALIKLATDPGLRGEMGRASRRRAQPVDETAAAVLEICREAATRP